MDSSDFEKVLERTIMKRERNRETKRKCEWEMWRRKKKQERGEEWGRRRQLNKLWGETVTIEVVGQLRINIIYFLQSKDIFNYSINFFLKWLHGTIMAFVWCKVAKFIYACHASGNVFHFFILKVSLSLWSF